MIDYPDWYLLVFCRKSGGKRFQGASNSRRSLPPEPPPEIEPLCQACYRVGESYAVAPSRARRGGVRPLFADDRPEPADTCLHGRTADAHSLSEPPTSAIVLPGAHLLLQNFLSSMSDAVVDRSPPDVIPPPPLDRHTRMKSRTRGSGSPSRIEHVVSEPHTSPDRLTSYSVLLYTLMNNRSAIRRPPDRSAQSRLRRRKAHCTHARQERASPSPP